MLAVKIVLVIRYDVFGEDFSFVMGIENRVKLEVRLRILEDRGVRIIFFLWLMFVDCFYEL